MSFKSRPVVVSFPESENIQNYVLDKRN